MARIAVGGFQHETNTFAPVKTPYEDFLVPGGWPALTRGEALFANVEGTSTPIAGAIAAGRKAGHTLVPLSWCMATPASYVTDDAFERIATMLLEELDAALAQGPLDAVYLDLHGAAVTESFEDAEGELIARVKARAGDIPVAVSLDLHANVTEGMVRDAALIDAYRHYPHIDMAETGARAMRALLRRLGTGRPWHSRFHKFPFLTAINWQCTMIEPGDTLRQMIDSLAANEDVTVAFCPGFALADIAECGPALAVYGAEQARADAVFEELRQAVEAVREDFAGTLWSPEAAIRHAMRADKPGPYVLCDTQDNPGGGGEADTTGILQALIDLDAQNALVAIIKDPEAARAAHAAGVGSDLDLELGAGTRQPGIHPVKGRFLVEQLSDGQTVGTGPMFGGNPINVGDSALLRIGGVQVLVTSRKTQVADQAILRHIGIEPKSLHILVLKSSVHFRADFQPIATEVLVVQSPGPVVADLASMPFRKLRPGVALTPVGPIHKETTQQGGGTP